jgi:hypothetical protein
MTEASATGVERRRYWISMAALAVALPAALVVQTWNSARTWRAENFRDPLHVERGEAQPYAGATWRLTDLARLAGGAPERTVVVAEFEATAEDAAPLVQVPCQVLLVDRRGRAWRPNFIPDRILRQMRPESVEKPRCGGPAFENVPKGGTVKMVETFEVPADAEGLQLSLTMLTARPQYLLFNSP